MIHVPKKNQPTVYQSDEIPAEDYCVLWNGQSLLVSWKLEKDTPMSWSGGHVVESILTDAAKRLDADVYFQGCNPSCPWLFVHMDIQLTMDPSADEWMHLSLPDSRNMLFARAPGSADLQQASIRAWRHYSSALRDFADMKNVGRQILDLELAIRFDLDRLNTLHHRRAEASQGSWWNRAKAAWTFRSWRRESRFYLARLWLGLGSLEHQKRLWRQRHAEFVTSVRYAEIEELFVIDTSDEVDSIRDLDLSIIEAALQHASSRLDTSAVVVATVGGAVAGAIAGALITLT
jgi:hypothetical protein